MVLEKPSIYDPETILKQNDRTENADDGNAQTMQPTDGSDLGGSESSTTIRESRGTTPEQDDPVDPLQLPAYIGQAMERVAKDRGFSEHRFTIDYEEGTNKGDGFVADLFKATVREGTHRVERFLCKVPPLSEARREQYPVMKIFARETLAYGTFLPLAFAYQESKGVRREDGFYNVPKCFYAECHKEPVAESVIVMEDLRLRGYRMWDKLIPVNYEHARLAMVQLGRLHAVSLALKRDRPEQLAQFKVLDPMDELSGVDSPFVAMLRQMVLDAVETLHPHETTERCKMQHLHDHMADYIERVSNGALAEPYAVVAHGDCWVNNFMFHYTNEAPTQIVLLDWQCLRYVSPVIDLVYFIFCCTDEDFRRLHYDDMMDTYHHSLASLLDQLGHSATEVFPRAALTEQLREFGCFGLLMAAFLVPLLGIRNEDLPDMEQMAEQFQRERQFDTGGFMASTDRNSYRKRMSAVIRDAVRYGYV